MRRSLRAALGSLQLPVAGVGVALLALSSWNLATLPPSPPESDGFVEGLAVLVLVVLALAGYVVFVCGLLVPPGPGYGVDFTRRQRWLFAYALVAPVVGVGGLAVVGGTAPGVLLESAVPGTALTTLVATAPVALVVGVGWRAAQAVAARV